jgi:predicted lipoprotein with Yx(FWY)xxD motif
MRHPIEVSEALEVERSTMARRGWFFQRRFATLLASMGAAALASCASSPGGIVVQNDAAGGADGASDARGAGGTGGAGGATADVATDVLVDVGDDRTGDGGLPPLCVYYTPPPPMLASFAQEGGADVSDTDAAIDSGPPEAGPADAASDTSDTDATTADASGPDGTSMDATADTAPGDASVADATTVDAGGDASGDRSGGRDGEGGDGPPPPSITVRMSPYLGPYLADSAGRTLYTFGNDKPGDCSYPPIPDCEADCAIAWPPFDAGKRTLAMGLDPNVFGSVARGDGVSQITTYYGWPLYYYRPDTGSGVINGQGKSKTWHVATTIPHNILIMRDKTNPRYIADGDGRTLYVHDKDTAGTASSDPVSACVGTCLTQYPPLLKNRINAVSSLPPNDLTLFVRPDLGRQQVAYKGAPLYLSAADMRSGDQKGVGMGWTVAAAP